MSRTDALVVGGGIAGASVAAELAARGAAVILLETEAQFGVHATGRSAAFWHETYGGPAIQPLTRASRSLLGDPPPSFATSGFLRPRGALTLGASGQEEGLRAFVDLYAKTGVPITMLGAGELRARLPGLRAGWTMAAVEPDCSDIDVAALHAAYLRAARRNGANLRTGARVVGVERTADGWRVTTGDGSVSCGRYLVNAAGAWADEVGVLAGLSPLGFRAYRRTIVQLRMAWPIPSPCPLVIDLDGSFYFKGEGANRLWLSPHDETPDEPGDVAPEEWDVALAIDRFTAVVDWPIAAVERRWAGLRTFAPDRLPVLGPDPRADGFWWSAGQGGFGIQTAPTIAANLAAWIATGRAPDLLARFAPDRLLA